MSGSELLARYGMETVPSALSSKTNLAGFDLPTEAQWEIAARAGSAEEYGSYVSVNGLVVKGTEANVGDFAIYNKNRTAPGHPDDVGRLRPNLWGLYDTMGNVMELFRDSSSGQATNVETPASDASNLRLSSGSYYNTTKFYFGLSEDRITPDVGEDDKFVGFRLLRICE